MPERVPKGWGTVDKCPFSIGLVLCWGTCRSCCVEDLRDRVGLYGETSSEM